MQGFEQGRFGLFGMLRICFLRSSQMQGFKGMIWVLWDRLAFRRKCGWLMPEYSAWWSVTHPQVQL